MLSAIVLTAAAIWILAVVLVLGLCRDAKRGDQAMALACGRSSLRETEDVVIELTVRRRERDTRRLAHLA